MRQSNSSLTLVQSLRHIKADDPERDHALAAIYPTLCKLTRREQGLGTRWSSEDIAHDLLLKWRARGVNFRETTEAQAIKFLKIAVKNHLHDLRKKRANQSHEDIDDFEGGASAINPATPESLCIAGRAHTTWDAALDLFLSGQIAALASDSVHLRRRARRALVAAGHVRSGEVFPDAGNSAEAKAEVRALARVLNRPEVQRPSRPLDKMVRKLALWMSDLRGLSDRTP
jgi:hypothetical protein